MSGCSITIRHRRDGPRYVVRYRIGGRDTPLTHAGSFKTLGEATLRRGLILDELAMGRNPALILRSLQDAIEGKTVPMPSLDQK
jgi:hypothetical protein